MNIAKFAVIATILLFLGGCGWFERGVATYTGYSKICIDGITYIQFTSGATVQVDASNMPVKCQ